VLVGNSVGNDKRFIDRHMPELAKRLHYRVVDVSSFKEIFRDKYNLAFHKGNAHRAVDDIFESIRELGFYLSFVSVPPRNDPKAGAGK
jgi:oligoribonuclease